MLSLEKSLPSAAKSEWWLAPPILEQHGRVTVVREDLIPGGSKIRFLPYIVGDAEEIVFGGPFCGGAPYALAVWGAHKGRKITLFYAARAELHWRQRAAYRLGATIYQVRPGYMTVVQKRARDYAAKHGALFLPLGFDVKHATRPYEAIMAEVRTRVDVEEVWCAVGSGMLCRCLARAFPDAQVHGVIVGLRSRNQAQEFPANVTLHECGYEFAEAAPMSAPFSACQNYEAKAWEVMQRRSKGRALFWNVLGAKEGGSV